MMVARRRLPFVILGNALMRIAGGTSGILVGLYLSDAANHGANVDVTLVGVLGAVSFGAELIGSVPMGLLSDAVAPRGLMTTGALLGAAATQLFGLSGRSTIFFLSRGLELSFLAGIALGGVIGGQLWRLLGSRAFAAGASIYVLAAGFLYFGAAGSKGHGGAAAVSGFSRALREPYLRRLAPVWLCVNTIVGLWLGPTLTFLMTQTSNRGQFLAGIFAEEPHRVGWVSLGYALVFGAGVTGWSVVLPRIAPERGLRIALIAMPFVCAGLLLINHSGGESEVVRWAIGGVTALFVMVESGFTPAALSLLAGAVGAQAGRGAAMGIYSVLLSIGAIAGSLLAAALGKKYAVDGLIYGTLALGLVALALARRLETGRGRETENP